MSTGESKRGRLSRERVLEAAVAFADEHGVEALSMRRLGCELGVEAMSLYNHVDSKKDVLDGVVDAVIAEIERETQTAETQDWKRALRERALAARRVVVRHDWAPGLIASRGTMTPTLLRYMDGMLGILFAGGFSIDLAHHAMHAIGSRMLGFTQELFQADPGPEAAAIAKGERHEAYPNITAMITEIEHDDQVEFEFGLDMVLDGLERALADERNER